ncbi:MAG: hypothetical protein FJ149_00755 [Euryarchaeota archaeon]|nr:hypothetical protein [Euryarchaeota archaeon]
MYSSFPEEHELRVMQGGTLRVREGSTVSSFDYTFGFFLDPGSIAEFSDSTFIACGMWYREVAQQITGGIISRTDALSVDNCTFASSHIALTATAPLRMAGTTFVMNYIGLIVLQAPLELSGCTFRDNTLTAVWVYRCTELLGICANFTGCTFTGNSFGISSDNSTCNIVGCRFEKNTGDGVWASALMHWYMPPSNLRLRDCLFEANAIGIGHYPDVACSTLEIVDCDFLNNSLAVGWENNGDAGNPPPDVTHWTVTRPCLARNNRFLLNGNLTIKGGGALDLSASNLTFDSDIEGESGLTVEGGGLLELGNGSLLRMHWASYPYFLRCLPGSSFRMNDTVLRDCGWNSSRPDSAGPCFEGASVDIGSSTIDYNPVGLVFRGATGASVRDTALRGLETAVVLDNSSAGALNSTLGHVAGPSAVLDRSSLLDCLNSTIDRGNLSFADDQSRLNLSWYLDVRARWADGTPAAGASLSVRDARGDEVQGGALDGDGRLRGLVLRESSLGRDGAESFTPHLARVSSGAVFNETAVTMDRSRRLDLVLEDREAPSIDITSPGPESFLASGTVPVNGTASDNFAVERVELLVDGFRRLQAYSADGPGESFVEWNVTLELREGPHSVEARSFDRSGNFASATVYFSVDFSAPRIRIAWPPDDHLTNLSVQGVSGYMEPGCRVLLGDAEVKTVRDTFGGTVILGEGPNYVTATAVDRAGNTNGSSVWVILDTRPPSLDVLWPPDGLRTGSPMVAVCGTMEPGASVYVNGRPVALTGPPGTFRTAIALTRPVNVVAVDAVDPAGNHNLTARTVILDTLPPQLVITHPPEGFLTNRSSVVLRGSSEGGTVLSVNGRPLVLPGEPGTPSDFSVPLELAEGLNTIFVSAEDPAGNLNTTVRHVLLDTSPPQLAVTAPESGHRTTGTSVFIIGGTEPGALVTVNGRPVPAGISGSFSLQAALDAGDNRFTVRAQDRAGNQNTTDITVRRLPSSGGELLAGPSGLDWPFIGFLALAAAAGASEGYLATRYIRQRRGA